MSLNLLLCGSCGFSRTCGLLPPPDRTLVTLRISGRRISLSSTNPPRSPGLLEEPDEEGDAVDRKEIRDGEDKASPAEDTNVPDLTPGLRTLLSWTQPLCASSAAWPAERKQLCNCGEARVVSLEKTKWRPLFLAPASAWSLERRVSARLNTGCSGREWSYPACCHAALSTDGTNVLPVRKPGRKTSSKPACSIRSCCSPGACCCLPMHGADCGLLGRCFCASKLSSPASRSPAACQDEGTAANRAAN